MSTGGHRGSVKRSLKETHARGEIEGGNVCMQRNGQIGQREKDRTGREGGVFVNVNDRGHNMRITPLHSLKSSSCSRLLLYF